jgi:hypothetical protein
MEKNKNVPTQIDMLDNMVKFVFKTDVQVKVEVNLKDNI